MRRQQSEVSMEVTTKQIEEILGSFFRRCELIRLAGGIALRDVVDRTATVPAGWVLDEQSYYYVPPGFEPTDTIQ
jgi:hypothetical protein